VTPMLTIENEHVPISVSIGDTLEREPTHICERDPAELVRKFVEELERRGKAVRDRVRSEFVPGDVNLLPKKQREQINEWCNQVPVLGFNSGSYDLNVIKKYFVENMTETANKITVAKKGNKIMFMHTHSFRFLDIGPIAQIVENRLIRFDERSFNVVNLQRPDWICGPFCAAFKLARLVEITDGDKGGEKFFLFAHGSQIRSRRFRENSFFFDGEGRFLACQSGFLIVQRGNDARKPLHPGSGPLALRQAHFHSILVPEQALSKSAVETFNNGLVAVNLNPPAPDEGFVLFHLFRDSTHEFAPGVDLQHLRPGQRAALVDGQKSFRDFIRIFRGDGFGFFVAAGDIDNGEGVFENFAPTRELVVRQKKKIRLVDLVGCGHVESRSRNVSRSGEEDLPERLPDKPLFGSFFRDFGGCG